MRKFMATLVFCLWSSGLLASDVTLDNSKCFNGFGLLFNHYGFVMFDFCFQS